MKRPSTCLTRATLLLAALVVTAAHPALAQSGPIYPGDEISEWTFAHPPVQATAPAFGSTRTYYDESAGNRLGITLYAAGKNPAAKFIGEKMQAIESLHVDFDLAAESMVTGVPRMWQVGQETGPPYRTRLAGQISGELELTGFLTVIGDSEAELEVLVQLLDCGP